MDKITIIGLGLVGNSIGMGLKRAAAGTDTQVVGFDPDRTLEDAALRRHHSVDSIAPDLETAVRAASLVILSTPASAVREVLTAINPFLEQDVTVTDTLSTKEQVLSWAGELLDRGSFVGGHPLSRTVDLDAPPALESPSADLFTKAPYCIIPLPSASNAALNRVIGLAETLGARPLFIDSLEHDSLFAAASHLPLLASAALLRVTSGSPSWQDISTLAFGQFNSMTAPLDAEPQALSDAVLSNRHLLTYWVDQYLLVLQDLRDMLAKTDNAAVLDVMNSAHAARASWDRHKVDADADDPMAGRRVEHSDELQAELQQAIQDTRPGNRILGRYLSDRVFGKKDK